MSIRKTLPRIIAIVGPTASGKTKLSVRLAKNFNGEIVSADSRQVYKEFSIGTAKPSGKWQAVTGESRYVVGGVVHYLMDEVDPKEEFTLVDFKKRALGTIEEILERGKLPFLVGGTALYIYTVTENLQIPQVPPQPSFRSRLQKVPVNELWAELNEQDSEAAEITGKNKRRIIRALEVIHATGKKFSAQRKKGPKLFNVLKIGIGLEKEELEERIHARMEEMLNEGLLDEVKNLAKKYSWSIPPMQSIDYQEFRKYLEGKETLDEALEKTIKDHKEFARRQMTWFKKDKEIHWIKNEKEAEKLVEDFIRKRQ